MSPKRYVSTLLEGLKLLVGERTGMVQAVSKEAQPCQRGAAGKKISWAVRAVLM